MCVCCCIRDSDSKLIKHGIQTRIRVKFPDQTQIETSFNSLETFPAVYAFVRSALREDAKDAPFVLCMYLVAHEAVGLYFSFAADRTTHRSNPAAEGIQAC